MATRGQSVARILRDRILDGTYKPGSRMNEIDISGSLGVSRTPVRGALGALAAEGLLEYVPNSGYVVRHYSVQDIEGVYAVRSVLEGLAARTVAENGLPDHQRGILHKILAETEALCHVTEWTNEVRDAWDGLNDAFHGGIVDAAGNRHLRELIAKTWSIPQLNAMKFRWHDLSVLAESYSEHAEIFDAITNRQGTRAEHLAREHVYLSGRRLIAHWRRMETAPPARRILKRVPHAA